MADQEKSNVDTVFRAAHAVEDGGMTPGQNKPLSEHFASSDRVVGITEAIKDGFTQVEIGRFLGLSNVAISRIYSNYRAKVALFNQLGSRGLFWSYSKTRDYDHAGAGLFVEYLLKYGDFDEIRLGFKLFGKRVMKRIWLARVVNSHQFLKLYVLLARVFFDMDVDADYFNELRNGRFEKLKLLAS